jgi:hypothetical protein
MKRSSEKSQDYIHMKSPRLPSFLMNVTLTPRTPGGAARDSDVVDDAARTGTHRPAAPCKP